MDCPKHFRAVNLRFIEVSPKISYMAKIPYKNILAILLQKDAPFHRHQPLPTHSNAFALQIRIAPGASYRLVMLYNIPVIPYRDSITYQMLFPINNEVVLTFGAICRFFLQAVKYIIFILEHGFLNKHIIVTRQLPELCHPGINAVLFFLMALCQPPFLNLSLIFIHSICWKRIRIWPCYPLPFHHFLINKLLFIFACYADIPAVSLPIYISCKII